jgi:TctA family transporter
MLLGFVLGPMMEENLRRAMVVSRGDPSVFVTRPLSLGCLAVAALILAVAAVPAVRRQRAAVSG